MISRIYPALALVASFAAAADDPSQQLTLTVVPPEVSVVPRGAGRHFVTLPALEYNFLLKPECQPGWQAEIMSLSIADSRQVLTSSSIDADGMAQTRLTVPAKQLVPIPISAFCESADKTVDHDSPEDTGVTLTISAAVSAHAALICANDGAEKITYVTQPLAVTLRCDRADDTSDSQ